MKIGSQNLEHKWTKDSFHIQIKIKIPNPSQEPPASSKVLNEDLKDINVLCTFNIKIESQNSNHGYIKDQWPYTNHEPDAKPKSGTSRILQSPKWGLQGHGYSLRFQNQVREPKLDHGCIKDHWPYLYQDQDVKPQSGTSCILQILKSGLQDMDNLCTLKIKRESPNLEHRWNKDHWPYPNQDQDAKTSQEPPVSSKALIWTWRTWMLFAPSKSR